jgi:hypothetical protein
MREQIKFNKGVMTFLKCLMAQNVILDLVEYYNVGIIDALHALKAVKNDIKEGDDIYPSLCRHLVETNIIKEEYLKNAFRNIWKVFRSAFLDVEGIEEFRNGFTFD